MEARWNSCSPPGSRSWQLARLNSNNRHGSNHSSDNFLFGKWTLGLQLKDCPSKGCPQFSFTSRIVPSPPYRIRCQLNTQMRFFEQYTMKRPFSIWLSAMHKLYSTKWVFDREEGNGQHREKLPSLLALPEIYRVYTFLEAHVGSESIFWVILDKFQTPCSLSNRRNSSHIPLNTCNHPLPHSMDIYSAIRMG